MCENEHVSSKKTFKGIENFLRRVSYNLGNSPSQTEVKIISCIPIDVTDLQQKIINLEKQLHEAKEHAMVKPPSVRAETMSGVKESKTLMSGRKPPSVRAETVPVAKQSKTVMSCRLGNITPFNESNQYSTQNEDSPKRKSTVSFIFPAEVQNSRFFSTSKSEQKDDRIRSTNVYCKNILRQIKKRAKKSQLNTQLVYYTQTTDSPFNINTPIDKNIHKNTANKSYLTDIIRKHYDPNENVQEYSDTSEFSSPICRDAFQSNSRFYESDACSCCHGGFQNVDKYMTRSQNMFNVPIDTFIFRNSEHNNMFYDSNLYDVVPVKEKPCKKKPSLQGDMRCWPENAHIKTHTNPMNRTQNNGKLERIKEREIYDLKTRDKHDEPLKTFPHGTSTDSSKSCYVECGDIYTKRVPTSKLIAKPTLITRHNAECLVNTINTNLQTVDTKSVQLEVNTLEDKNETTLNQIKSILQSVLIEVKTNAQKDCTEKSTKDAIIQKGSSQSNKEQSRLLHSYTYDTSNVNPYVSCSHQMPTRHFHFPNYPYQHLKYTQHLPVLIQAPRRHVCACHVKEGHFANPNKETITTNADNNMHVTRSKETEYLIKEIYKSIALNMDFPTKETSSECNLESDNTNKSTAKVSKQSTVAPIINQNVQTTALFNTKNFGSCSESQTLSNTVSSDTEQVETYFKRKDRSSNTNTENEVYLKKTLIGLDKENKSVSLSEVESEQSISNTESNETIMPIEEQIMVKKPKKNIIQRMIKSVKLFRKKRKTTSHQTENSSENDSDYETVYSDSTNQQIKPIHQTDPKKMFENSTYREQQNRRIEGRNRNRPSPYMEQEYIRHWNEGFHAPQTRYSSERAVLRQPRPVYWRNYEARSVIVDRPREDQCGITHEINNEEQKNCPNLKNGGKLAWLKKRKLGINCGEQWKKFVLEN